MMFIDRNLFNFNLIGYLLNVILFLLISEVTFLNVVQGHGFGYTEPDQRLWAKKHSHCGGNFQSPIAINTEKAIPIEMPAIEMVGYHNLLNTPLKLHNNGHSVSMSIPKISRSTKHKPNDNKLPYIFGGRLDSEYEIEGLHFHWGDKNNRGSEHVLNGIRYPMEMHIIHRNKLYGNVSEALNHPDGLCVLGFFYQLKDNDGPELTNIVRYLTKIDEYNDEMNLDFTFSLSTLLGHIDTERFYTYQGSLTTPPCSEAVRWVLFPDTLQVSVSQMNQFRQLSSSTDGLLVDNFRTLQPLRNRYIFVRDVNTQNTDLSDLPDIHYSEWDWINERSSSSSSNNYPSAAARRRRHHHNNRHHRYNDIVDDSE